MLEDLRRYNNLGTPKYFFELFNTLRRNQEIVYTMSDVDKLFYNREIDNRSVFDGCVKLAIKINFLFHVDNLLTLNEAVIESLNDIDQMKRVFIKHLFEVFVEDDNFCRIFFPEFLSYDVIHKSLQISNQAFGLKYYNLKQLLLDFGVIKIHPIIEFKSYLINNSYKNLIDKIIVPEVKQKRISVEDFWNSMEQKQIFGVEAEKFVLEFESIRLNRKKKIDWIAQYVVNEGYDIASYNYEHDEIPNRFIEVKSYEGNIPYFFWSRNEFMIAQLKKEEYWLYLINRKEMNNPMYTPVMIQNPYEKLLRQDSSWNKQIEKYKIQLLVK